MVFATVAKMAAETKTVLPTMRRAGRACPQPTCPTYRGWCGLRTPTRSLVASKQGPRLAETAGFLKLFLWFLE